MLSRVACKPCKLNARTSMNVESGVIYDEGAAYECERTTVCSSVVLKHTCASHTYSAVLNMSTTPAGCGRVLYKRALADVNNFHTIGIDCSTIAIIKG